MFGAGIHSPEDRRFVGLAAAVVDDLLARDPAHATRVGDHRFDSRLPDLTQDGIDEFARVLQRHAAFLDSVDSRALSRVTAADLQILRAGVGSRLFDLTRVRAHSWNPLVWNPADALHSLVSRDFAPAAERAAALRERLSGVPEMLENARHTLGEMPAPHVRTAIDQIGQIEPMLSRLPDALADGPGVRDAAAAAADAVQGHVSWLRSRLAESHRDPALGPELFAGVLQHHLDSSPDPDELLARAEDSLEAVLDDLASQSAKFLRGSMADRSVIPKALDRLAADSDVDDGNILDVARSALDAAAAFAAERRLVTVPDLDIRVEPMPGVYRGVAVAHCDAPGQLEPVPLPTTIAISPAPERWGSQRRHSYYREYNRHLLYDLMVHEGVPGHALQLHRAAGALSPTSARAALPSALFVEGWAVYAEEMMAHRGFAVSAKQRPSLRIQQLKMQLRTIINTILDIRFHTRGMTEAEGRRLMATRGYQQEAEIVGKWRRAQLTHGQLSTYYVGYLQLAQVINDLDERQRDWSLRQVHDAVLAHGSVPPRVLPALVGLE